MQPVVLENSCGFLPLRFHAALCLCEPVWPLAVLGPMQPRSFVSPCSLLSLSAHAASCLYQLTQFLVRGKGSIFHQANQHQALDWINILADLLDSIGDRAGRAIFRGDVKCWQVKGMAVSDSRSPEAKRARIRTEE
eukprot:1159148-Pelagomonas_calceolata.AAC.5